jgi:hypothetical protein
MITKDKWILAALLIVSIVGMLVFFWLMQQANKLHTQLPIPVTYITTQREES